MARNFIEDPAGSSLLPTLDTINDTIKDAIENCHRYFVSDRFVVESVSTFVLTRPTHLTVFASVVAKAH